ncbi:2Fe-2S iron-sulfur cluster-binding protein [Yoonia sp.]|uniref:2Fe-2S iron-sulfur cluster-binding protein n=1 Tax=Yoonia sp. TaxID=2212373 RepID=UPI0019F3ED6C|nr:2Fe-2S iron-sulfur cluster-binding protein [Yoonia sp.]MBE0413717.1 2Fe-2S iron-sulfur cluster binding domain-containing protein [Yoonia sp.]
MAQITFIQPDGSARVVDAPEGETLMIAATTAGVDGIVAECGGSCMCATCHCLVVSGPTEALPVMEDAERDTLEFTAQDMQDTSRLTCQIKATEALSGLTLRVVGR